jgi:uncharacterized membrane protein YsdA (DUF1294 family)/cold shock CspA family protein
MQQSGKIIKWNDEKGFGFIQSDASNSEYFFHISSYQSKGSRPSIGIEVNFKASVDDKGRDRAIKVRTVNSEQTMGPAKKAFIVSFIFLSAVGVATLLGYIPRLILYLYLIMSVITFIYYAWDKSSAKRSRSRIAEATLHNLSLFGGWPGALFAQQILRHKSFKKRFRLVFWMTVLLNLASLTYLISPYGNWILQKVSELTFI